MVALKRAGCIALTDNGRPLASWLTLKRVMEYAHSADIALHLTPIVPSLLGSGCAHEGDCASRLGLPGIPHSAETGALAIMLELIVETRAQVHFSQLSCRRSVELITAAKQRNLPVTADVSVHHLVLNESAIEGFNTLCHTYPPLRTEDDQQALLDGVNSGIIDAITSQHRPCSSDDKLTPFPASRPGIAGVELLLPLVLKLIDDKQLDQKPAFAALTSGPARVLGIEPSAHMTLSVEDATFDPEEMLSHGNNAPYCGWRLKKIRSPEV